MADPSPFADDATKADKVAALQAQKDEIARRLRDD